MLKTTTIHKGLVKNYIFNMVLLITALIISNLISNIVVFNKDPVKMFESTVAQAEQNINITANEISNIVKSIFYNNVVQQVLEESYILSPENMVSLMMAMSSNSNIIHKQINNYLLWFPQIKNIEVFYANGIKYDCALGVSFKKYDSSQLNNKAIYWETIAAENRLPNTYLTMKINSRDNLKQLCVVRVQVNTQHFANLIGDIDNAYGNLFIISGNKDFIGDLDYLNQNSFQNQLTPQIIEESINEEKNIKNLNVYTVFVSRISTATNFSVCGIFTYQYILKSLLASQFYSIFFALFFILLYILKSRKNSEQITDSIKKIQDEMRKIENGEFDVEIEQFKYDEFNQVSSGLSLMSQNLQELIKKEYIYKIQLQEAKFEALQSQINPHFIYNTLETIHSALWIEQHTEIAMMVTSLADLLRYSTSQKEAIVKVSDEFTIIEKYLSIQKFRFGERFKYSITVDKSVTDVKIPKFIIQPLAENAVVHGIESKLSLGEIDICAYKSEDCVIIEILDNGVGMDENLIKTITANSLSVTDTHSRIGINNINSRIKFLYGDDYGLKIESQLNQYTKVTLKIPAN